MNPYLLQYAMQFAGQWYKYGGDEPGQWDCSGYVCELLLAGGVLPFGTRKNAQGLYDFLASQAARFGTYGPGSIAFYGADASSIIHTGFCLDSNVMLEAGGGDSTVINDQTAITHHAFIKLRPIKYRRDFLTVVRPDYARIGVTL